MIRKGERMNAEETIVVRERSAARRFAAGIAAPLLAISLLAPASARADDPPKTVEPEKAPPLFKVDPVADSVLIAAGLGFSGIDELILSTGEIAPQRPGSTNNLLGIDRIAVTQTIDPNASTYSNIGLGVALGFAALDPILSGLRDGPDAGLVDGIIYAESLSLTLAITDITKVAFRRPRPIAYQEQAALDAQYGGASKAPSISDTDATLSFFSGHASIIGAASATATYLAFMRSPGTWRPWVTLVAGTLLTTGVSYERVRAGAHFPTDVIAGALAGGCIGVLVPHLHRFDSGVHHLWVGANAVEGGGQVTLGGLL
jgi:membrane-associated phospholipid phosphatase